MGQLLDSSRRQGRRALAHALALGGAGPHAGARELVEIRSRSTSRSCNARPLTPNDFSSLDELEERLLGFQQHYEQIATPFRWTFTRHDLKRWLAKLDNSSLTPAA